MKEGRKEKACFFIVCWQSNIVINYGLNVLIWCQVVKLNKYGNVVGWYVC